MMFFPARVSIISQKDHSREGCDLQGRFPVKDLGGRTCFARMGLLRRPKRFFQEPTRVSSVFVAMLMLSSFRCSCFFSEDFLRIVLASPSLGFAPIQEVLRDNGIHRTTHENHFMFEVLDACPRKMSYGSSLRCLHSASTPIPDALLENGFSFDRDVLWIASGNRPCRHDPDKNASWLGT